MVCHQLALLISNRRKFSPSEKDVNTLAHRFFCHAAMYSVESVSIFVAGILEMILKHPEREQALVQAVDHFLRNTLQENWFPLSLLQDYVAYLKRAPPLTFMKRNRFSVSFGLVVRASPHQVVVLQRRLPYCVQNYLFKVRPLRFDRAVFEKNVYPKLNTTARIDYDHYCAGLEFEDSLDFPHGQMQKKHRIVRDHAVDYFKVAFRTAFKEFVEETGYTFSYDPSQIPPLRRVDFEGLDGCHYTQFYFLVNHVKRLRRACKYSFGRERKEEQLVYRGLRMDAEKVLDILTKQQKFKADQKQLLLTPEALPEVTVEELVEKILLYRNL